MPELRELHGDDDDDGEKGAGSVHGNNNNNINKNKGHGQTHKKKGKGKLVRSPPPSPAPPPPPPPPKKRSPPAPPPPRKVIRKPSPPPPPSPEKKKKEKAKHSGGVVHNVWYEPPKAFRDGEEADALLAGVAGVQVRCGGEPSRCAARSNPCVHACMHGNCFSKAGRACMACCHAMPGCLCALTACMRLQPRACMRLQPLQPLQRPPPRAAPVL